jgi:hypothetical protein
MAERESFCRERENFDGEVLGGVGKGLAVTREGEKQIPHYAKSASFGMAMWIWLSGKRKGWRDLR